MSADLQAALVAEPDNPEAKALLHQRSVTVEKVGLVSTSNAIRFTDNSNSCFLHSLSSEAGSLPRYGGKSPSFFRGETSRRCSSFRTLSHASLASFSSGTLIYFSRVGRKRMSRPSRGVAPQRTRTRTIDMHSGVLTFSLESSRTRGSLALCARSGYTD